MSIEGLNVRCNVGPVEVLRSPCIELVYRRRAVVSRGLIHVPDPEGTIRNVLSDGQSVKIRFGYRGEVNLWHEWTGSILGIDQPSSTKSGADALIVRCVGQEQKLATTLVSESFYNEPASVVAARLLARTGLSVAGVEIPDNVLPHQVFSNVPVSRALKQIEQSLSRAYGHDMSKHAVWLGADGLRWSAGDEPGDVLAIETAQNLISHTPAATPGGMGAITSVLLPGLTDGRQISIRDTRRGIVQTVRAQEVRHALREGGNTTTVLYGKETGWGS